MKKFTFFVILIFGLNSIVAALSNEKQKTSPNNETNEAFKSHSIDIPDWINNMNISNKVEILKMTLQVCQISHFEIKHHNSTHSHIVESKNITNHLCKLLPQRLIDHRNKKIVTIEVHKNSTSDSHISNHTSGNQKDQQRNQKEQHYQFVESEHNSTTTQVVHHVNHHINHHVHEHHHIIHHKKPTHTTIPPPQQLHSANSGSSISNGAIFGIIFFILVVIAAAVIILRTKWGRPIRAERGGPSEHYNTLPDDMQQANLI